MIRGRYGLLIAGVVIAMLSVAAGAGFLMVYVPLPDPAVATRQELFRWLVLRDLSQESMEIRQKILSRVDIEFKDADDLGSTIQNMDDSRRRMLWHNITVLLEPWLLDKVEQYSQLPVAQQIDYIDRFLDRAELWNKIGTACLKKSAKQGPKSGSSASQLIMEQIEQCSNHAPPEQRRRIGAFMTAVQARWLWRQLPSFKSICPSFGVR